jgi:hypothetical protein
VGWSSSDSKIPEDDSKADFSDSYAFEEAVRAEQLEALKKMQAEKYPDRSSRPADD